MGKFVVDANVAIKWVLPEIHTDIALRLLDDDSNILLVPDFFFPEIRNILWKRVRRGEATLEQALLSLNELKGVNLQIRFSSSNTAMSKVCRPKRWRRTPITPTHLAAPLLGLGHLSGCRHR